MQIGSVLFLFVGLAVAILAHVLFNAAALAVAAR